MNTSLILNIPHASTTIPQWIYDEVFLPQRTTTQQSFQPLDEKKRMLVNYELLMMTDWYTDELFDRGLFPAMKAPVSRLVRDTERYADDPHQALARMGPGLCYSTGFDLCPIKRFSEDHRRFVLENYYLPHHRRLEGQVDESLKVNDRALILDCHSFHPIPLPYEGTNSSRRPDICIGADDFHTPVWLRDLAAEHFRKLGYTVSINDPFAGSLVPLKHYRRDSRVLSVMVELNRQLYLKDGTNASNAHFHSLRRQILSLEKKLERCLGNRKIA